MKVFPRWGAALVAAWVIIGGVVAPSPAQAAPPTVPALELVAGNPGDNSFVFEYGATTPASRLITIGPDTRVVLFDPPFGPVSPEMQCSLLAGDGSLIAERLWSDGEWWSAPHTLEVPEGAVAGDGRPYTASCETRAEYSMDAIWSLVGDSEAGAELTLDAAPEKATRTTEREPLDGGSFAWGTAVAPGERLRIRGPSGVWFLPGYGYALDVRLEVSSAGIVTFTGPAEQVGATVDGAVLGFTIPSDLAASPGDEIYVSIESTSTVPGSAATAEQVRRRGWDTRLVVAKKTTTTLTLDRRYALSKWTSVNAGVVVTDPAGAPIEGSLSLVIDGERGPVVPLSGIGSAVAKIRLPELGRGLHTVVAVFEGSDSLLGSTSAQRHVRILR